MVIKVSWKSCVLRLDEAWVWEVNEEMNKMWEICWQVPNTFEQEGLSFPEQLGSGELAPDFEGLGLSESMAPTHELSKVLQVITL